MEEEEFSFSIRQKIYLPFKRLLDIIFSLIAISLLLPFMGIIAIIVWVDTKGFPIFRQRRIGKNNKEFLILKFRSMNKSTPTDIPTHLLENPDRYITRFGRFIRRTSIDELPQLFNIFVGHMSFIGPRPALWSQKDLIEGRNKNCVCYIRPGLSGYAQCHGRDEVSISEKINLDTYYLKNFSFFLDIKIFFSSIVNVIKEKNVVEGKQS